MREDWAAKTLSHLQNKNPASIAGGILFECLTCDSVAIKQHSIALLCAVTHWAIEQLIAFQVNLNECRTRGNGPLDQRLRQRIFNVPLQGPAQWTRAIAAVHKRLVQNPPFRFLGHRDRDVAL